MNVTVVGPKTPVGSKVKEPSENKSTAPCAGGFMRLATSTSALSGSPSLSKTPGAAILVVIRPDTLNTSSIATGAELPVKTMSKPAGAVELPK